MDYPKGRECSESDCMWLAPKRGAPTENRSIGDYECAAKEKDWPDCPRAVRATLKSVCEKLAAWDVNGDDEAAATLISEACSLAREVVNA